MNLWQLNIFCKVIELKSFSKAGKEICISQPTISSHIKDLENYFNYKLIDQKKIFKDQICLVVKKNHKWANKKTIGLKMLIKEPFIIREKGSGTLDSIQKNLSDNNYSLNDLNIIAEMDSTSAVCQGIKRRA